MLLTLSTDHTPASDLGFLLRKHPDKLQTFELSFGKAHVFYPESSDHRCTMAFLVEVDSVALVRNQRGAPESQAAGGQYVNDRPYAASSFLSVALAQVFGSALSGTSRERPELADQPLPLVATISALPCRGGLPVLTKLFAPLGYQITAERIPLDPELPDLGESLYHEVRLEGTLPVKDLLAHLYVLIPVLDHEKHYWVGEAEVAKLMRRGGDWLAAHPDREFITRRYLKNRRNLVDDALAQLARKAGVAVEEPEVQAREEEQVEETIGLHEQRLGAVMSVLKSSGARSVLDLGCGEAKLLRSLLAESQFTSITGMDVSHRALAIARNRLRMDRLPESQKDRIRLLHGSLIYRDSRLEGFDAAAVVEVVEHLDPSRLDSFERVLFECARPRTVVITTPNSEYNQVWETLPAGTFRHRDHRFEWTRAEFQDWSARNAATHGYGVRFLPIGGEHPDLGPPTQMAIFSLL